MTPCGFLKHSNVAEQFIESHSLLISEILIINIYNMRLPIPWLKMVDFGTLTDINNGVKGLEPE